ncbi:Actin-related protein 2/3 complex subunit 2A [Platanthera guangdongensis]|uniref:Arp2/3 complex 34 kDa subunit n=1 Tax=Platanthera guangdongensis TaxID=2320717 RepID=A0ABR2MLB8_9ASPA
MILLQPASKFLLQILENRLLSLEKSVDLDCHSVEFDDVRYHIQFSMKSPQVMFLSISLPTPPPETVFISGLPLGAIEAIKGAYGELVQILDPPKDGYNLTMKLNLAKFPKDEEQRKAILVKFASVREVVLGAPLRMVLHHLASRTIPPNVGQVTALVHRPKESFFLIPQTEKVTVIFPMRFRDSIDIVLATSFLQEFVEARRAATLSNAPLCTWSPVPPQELNDALPESVAANAGFVTFVIYPRHADERKLEKTAWSLSTFHAYVNYHVKCSEGFMHTRMRRRVETLIQALDRAKPELERAKSMVQGSSIKRLNLKDARGNSFS